MGGLLGGSLGGGAAGGSDGLAFKDLSHLIFLALMALSSAIFFLRMGYLRVQKCGRVAGPRLKSVDSRKEAEVGVSLLMQYANNPLSSPPC